MLLSERIHNLFLKLLSITRFDRDVVHFRIYNKVGNDFEGMAYKGVVRVYMYGRGWVDLSDWQVQSIVSEPRTYEYQDETLMNLVLTVLIDLKGAEDE